MLGFREIRSVVIIGASEDPKKIGNILMRKNQDFSGGLYGVNPKGGEVYGKSLYTSIESLPETPDLAVFAIPAALVPASLEEAGKKGIKKAIIITAGFKEVGNTDAESLLQSIATKYGVRILGPNCLGWADTTAGLDLSFGGRFFRKGNIGIISQSGAMAVAITDVLDDRGVGFSSFFSLGNKSDIDESDVLEELMSDPSTHVIALYVESIARGEHFLDTLKSVTPSKPVIIMIGGVSEGGKRATASHTGSLSGDRLIYEAAIRQGGAILTYSLGSFFDTLESLSRSYDKEIMGRPLIITNAGGPGVLATDQCSFQGVELQHISESDAEKLRENMPTTMSTRNPIDIIGDADSTRVSQMLSNIANIRNSFDILFIFTIQETTDIDAIAQVLISHQQSHPKSLIMTAMIGGETVESAGWLLRTAGIPVLSTTESLISSYAHILQSRHIQHTSTPHEPSSSRQIATTLLSQDETEALLQNYQIHTTESVDCTTLDNVIAYTTRQSGPYVIKIAGKHIAHKTELGGVFIGLKDLDACRDAYDTIQANTAKYLGDVGMTPVSISRHITSEPSFELFFGAKRDATFGEIYVIGAGGIYLSILDDTRLHIGSWTREQVGGLLASLRSYPALTGYRRQPPANLDKLIDMIVGLSRLFHEHPEIQEIDINPILFDHGEPIIADAKLYV